MVATEKESTLSLLVQEFADPDSTAIYVGYRDGMPRPTIWGVDERGAVRTIAKYASGAREGHSLHNEYQILRSLNDLPRFVGRVPSPCAFEHGHLGSMLVTDAFDGLPGPLKINAAVEQWLMDCIVGPEIAAGASSLLQTIERQAVEHGGIALAAFAPAYEQLKNTRVPTTIVHGDFTPWNIFVDADTVRVFDWETAILDGIPEWDRVFYIFRTGLIAQAWRPDRLVKEVRLQARQSSEFYGTSEWKAVLTSSLVNLLVTTPQVGNATDTLEGVLDELLRSWWG